jgi:uncharacterized membrane protein YfcA
VPLLTYVLGVPTKAAIASSLLIVGVTSLAALVTHARNGLVVWGTGLPFGMAAMLGAYGGGTVTQFVPDSVLLLLFGAMMVSTAVAMLRGKAVSRTSDAPYDAPLSNIVLHGLGVGALAGLVGAGGGFLIVPALVLLGGMPMRKAVATSLLVISMQSFAGFVGQLGHTAVPWLLVLPMTILATLASVLAGLVAKKVRPESLRRGFAWLVMLVALFVVAHQARSAFGHASLYAIVFEQRWPWWIGGLAVAAVALGLLFVENKQLGVSAGCGELGRLPHGPEARSSWRPRFLGGIVLGGMVAALLGGHAPTLAMGSLDQLVHGTAPKLALLFGAGLLIGGGARLAGGCTSGHSIIGTALGARASWLATGLFMVAGFATTRLVLFLHGGV